MNEGLKVGKLIKLIIGVVDIAGLFSVVENFDAENAKDEENESKRILILTKSNQNSKTNKKLPLLIMNILKKKRLIILKLTKT